MTCRMATVAAFAALVPSAAATLRYASPAGAGTACTDTSPCQVEEAIQNAGTGDEVIVLPGVHQVILPFSEFADGVTIRGADNQPRPTIQWDGLVVASEMLRIFGTGVVMRDVVIRGNNGTPGGLEALLVGSGLSAANTTLDGVVVDQTGIGLAVIGARWNVRNSVLRSVGGNGAILSGTLTGSTVIAPASGRTAVRVSSGFDSPSTSLVVRNTILRGGAGIGGADLSTDTAGQPSHTSTANIDSSSYTAGRLRSDGPGTTTITTGPRNVLASPLLVDLAGGTDVHQLPGSPTIDGGDPASVQGTSDFEGDARVVAVADIGADEYVPPPAATTVGASAVTPDGATLNGMVNTFTRTGTYRFEYGTTTAYGAATPDTPTAASTTLMPVSSPVSGLAPATTYHARIVAVTDRGTTTGPDVTFTTQASPAALPAPPAVGRLTVTPTRVRTNRTARITFSLSSDARVTVVIDRLERGRRRAGRCFVAATTGPRCTRLTLRGVLRRDLRAAAAARFPIPAKVRGKRLLPGRYRLTVSALDALRRRSNVRRIIITVR